MIHFAGTRASQRRSAVRMDWRTGILHRSHDLRSSWVQKRGWGQLTVLSAHRSEAAINVIGTNNETDDND